MTHSGIELVNVVGAGEIGVEIDLSAVNADINLNSKYNPDNHTGMHIRLDNNALITLYRTGSYHVVGVNSKNELYSSRNTFMNSLEDMGIDVSIDNDSFSVRNIVGTASLSSPIELNETSIKLGLEQIEYEPEQFPGLIYRPESSKGVVLMFSSGKLVITGIQTSDEATDILNNVKRTIGIS
jgi:transcription initiation factor TFIID TATA-box-binding protein